VAGRDGEVAGGDGEVARVNGDLPNANGDFRDGHGHLPDGNGRLRGTNTVLRLKASVDDLRRDRKELPCETPTPRMLEDAPPTLSAIPDHENDRGTPALRL